MIAFDSFNDSTKSISFFAMQWKCLWLSFINFVWVFIGYATTISVSVTSHTGEWSEGNKKNINGKLKRILKGVKRFLYLSFICSCSLCFFVVCFSSVYFFLHSFQSASLDCLWFLSTICICKRHFNVFSPVFNVHFDLHYMVITYNRIERKKNACLCVRVLVHVCCIESYVRSFLFHNFIISLFVIHSLTKPSSPLKALTIFVWCSSLMILFNFSPLSLMRILIAFTCISVSAGVRLCYRLSNESVLHDGYSNEIYYFLMLNMDLIHEVELSEEAYIIIINLISSICVWFVFPLILVIVTLHSIPFCARGFVCDSV